MSKFLASRLGEECALFQANTMVREATAGHFDAAAKTYSRFVETLGRVEHPDLSLARVVKRLGRDKALAVGVEPAVVEDSIRNWAKYCA